MKASNPFRRVTRLLPPYRARFGVGFVLVFLGTGLTVYAPMLLRKALNALERDGDAAQRLAEATDAAMAFLAVSALAGGLAWARRILIITVSRDVGRDLKRDLFEHLERLPISFFDRNRAGDLLARLTSDVEAVRWVVGPGPMYIAGTVTMLPLALVAMMQISVPVTLAALAPLVLIIVVVRILAPAVMRRSRAVQDRIGDLSARAQESFAGARVIRAYATEDTEIQAFEAENDRLVQETLGLARHRALMQGVIYGLGGLAQLVVLVYGGSKVMEGQLGFGDLGAYLAYVGLLVWPMISVGWVVSAIQRAAAAIARIDEILRVEPEHAVTTEPASSRDGTDGALRVSNLTFSYPGARAPALRDVDLSIPGGGTLALVGPVGGGKSTVLALLTRTYEPPPRTMFLDEVDVTRIPLPRLRGSFAVVPQDPFLFSDTIYGNLAYAVDDELERERALGAAEAAGLRGDLEAFPRGLDTVVGERGLTLSGGQKQRTTLARALLRRAPILVLDDALSSVDTQTEAKILDRLRREMGQRTILLVAHRLSTVRDADMIVVLEDGRVAESGTHEALLAADGWYARTYRNQRLEAELETLE